MAGTEFAGGIRPPTHLIFDSFERKNKPRVARDRSAGRQDSRALTPEAGQQAAAGPPSRQRGVSTNCPNPVGPFDSYLDMGLYDRCITRGIPSSMMPAGYGSYYEIY